MENVSNQIIDALGGTTVVSRMTETSPSTVHSWRKNGIPRSRLAHLRLVADREGLVIDWETGAELNHAGADTGSEASDASGNAGNLSAAVSA
ncbi:carph-isopro domain-containing protein [Sphingomonas sp. PAMC 26621]|uniref:carph-isopro domain-containing protein n=1 Tax=Sphingomonas sp. PAMC 26621 TaxID=1112213 RepID=UPI0009DABF03|nr:hypothetical protein [Sphingomonas sp. PAMC 26621]